MRKLCVAFLAVGVLIVSAVSYAQSTKAVLLSGPYVIALTTDGGTVCWQTTAKVPGAVRVKSESGTQWADVKEARATQFHAVKVGDLAAGTPYQVQVLSGDRKLGELSFRTAPKSAETFTFYAYGDTRSHPDAHKQVTTALLAEAERRKQWTFVLDTGDMAEDPDKEATDEHVTAEQFFVPAAPLLARLPLLMVRGNHENSTDLFKKYFPAPERPAAEQVDMHVRHFLPAMLAHVEQQPVAGLLQVELLCHGADGAPEAGDFGVGGMGGEIGDRHPAAFRDHQHMHRRLRRDVVERQRPGVLVDLLAGDFAAQDAGEDVLVVVLADTLHRHCPPSVRPGQGILLVCTPRASGRARTRAARSAMPEMPSRRRSSVQTSSGCTSASTHMTIRW